MPSLSPIHQSVMRVMRQKSFQSIVDLCGSSYKVRKKLDEIFRGVVVNEQCSESTSQESSQLVVPGLPGRSSLFLSTADFLFLVAFKQKGNPQR